MMEQAGHSRSGSNTRPATTMGGGDTTSDVSGMLKKYKIVILGEQSSKRKNEIYFYNYVTLFTLLYSLFSILSSL